MDNYIPRVILIDSITMTDNNFLCGFVDFPKENMSGIGSAIFIPGGSDLPCLLYAEEGKVDQWQPVQLLPAFTFNKKYPMPKEFDVAFQHGNNSKPPKIKVTATMGHPDTNTPILYAPRVFILEDEDSGSVAYGFLVDIYEEDNITYEIFDKNDAWVTITPTGQINEIINTAICIFPINTIMPSFMLNLEAQGKGIKEIPYEGAPDFNSNNSTGSIVL